MSGAGLYTRLLFPRRLRGDSLGFVGCGRRATYPPEPWAVTSSNFNVGCGIPKPDHTKTALCSFWFSALCYIYIYYRNHFHRCHLRLSRTAPCPSSGANLDSRNCVGAPRAPRTTKKGAYSPSNHSGKKSQEAEAWSVKTSL